ncbi:AAA family ATPase [Actinocorallia herbida]|nr:LuxR family transcriptional regulator [Actinocorallia herbida]
MVERETQLADLLRLLEDCAGGTGGTALITGPLGAGKSVLLRTFAGRARASGALVLDAEGLLLERDIPLGVLRQLFQDAPLADAERAAVDGLLTSAELCRPSALDIAPELRLPTLANRRLWTVLRAIAERVPVVIAVDDLHHADDASLHSLSHFCERAATARILVVAATAKTRAAADRRHGVWLTDLLRQPQFHQVRVALLSEEGVTAMAARRLGPATARRLTGPWTRLTGGNPLLVLALLADAPAVGEEYGRSVVACVRRGGRDLLTLARALAVLGDGPARHLLRELLDLPEENVVALLETARAAGVLDASRFRHPSAAPALLADMPTAERAALHRKAADLLHRDGASPERVARHLVAAGHAAEDWAFDILYAAAAEALRADDPEFSGVCLDLAERAGVQEPERLRTALLRARVEFRANPLAAFRRLTPFVDRRSVGPEGADLIPPLLWHGRTDDAARILDALGDRVPDERAVTALQTAWEMAWSGHSPAFRKPTRTFEDSAAGRALVDRAPSAGPLAEVLRDGPTEGAAGSAETVLQSLSLDDDTFWALHSALLALVYAGRTRRAADWCDALSREAVARRAPTWQALLAAVRAEIALRDGEPSQARAHARDALSLVSWRGWGVAIGLPVSCLVLASVALGVGERVPEERGGLPEAVFGTRYGAQYLYAVGLRHLAEDRAEAALRGLTEAGRLLAASGADVPSFVPWRSGAVAALLRLGRPDEARALAAEQRARPGATRKRGPGLPLLGSRPAPRGRTDLWEEAAALLDPDGRRARTTRSPDVPGIALRRPGPSPVAARRTGRPITEVRVPLASGRVAVASAPGARPDVGALSSAELRVARLAAEGRTNREISRTLFVTLSTVEQHLTRVYRKLDIPGRADLTTAFPPRRPVRAGPAAAPGRRRTEHRRGPRRAEPYATAPRSTDRRPTRSAVTIVGTELPDERL